MLIVIALIDNAARDDGRNGGTGKLSSVEWRIS